MADPTTPAKDGSDLEAVTKGLGDAISCILGLAVLSGNFTLIVQALDTIHTFQKLLKAE